MQRKLSVLVGGILILVGSVSLAFDILAPRLGLAFWHWGAWRLWPLSVVSVGLLLMVSPLLVRGRRGLGGLFIPGVPVLATGGILLYASLFDAWHAWEWLWPVEVLSMALGFLLAAIYMRAIWLLLPAVLIGANGALLQYCAFTGWWEAWAVLWTVEPLSIGLVLLAINIKQRSTGLLVAGLVLSIVAAMGLIGMTAVFPGWWLVNLVGPVILLLAGIVLLVWGVTHRPSLTKAPVE